MDFSSIIQQRYSVRAYRSDPVEPEKITTILEAGRLAPTAANRQPFGIIVAHPQANPEQFSRLYNREWILQAPAVLMVCTMAEQAWVNKEGVNYAMVDAAIVMDHMILAATELGLGTCWIAAFDPQTAREYFKLPKGVEPVIMTTVGYPAIQPVTKERKPLAELVHKDRW